MTKKEIWVTLGIFLVVLASVSGGVLFAVNKQNKAQTANISTNQQIATGVAQQSATTNEPQLQQNTSGSDSITVVAGQNTSNPAQLGSGQVAAKQDTANTPASAPGPESFGQYEQYKNGQNGLFGDIVVGTGNAVAVGQKMAVYYKGWLTNGHMFDQSKTGNDGKLQPFVLTLGAHQVIRGWEEALVGMKVGGTRRIIVPPAAGYGATAQGSIPANSVLVFDVELLAIQ